MDTHALQLESGFWSEKILFFAYSEVTSQCVQFVEQFKFWVTHSRAYLTSWREGDATTLQRVRRKMRNRPHKNWAFALQRRRKRMKNHPDQTDTGCKDGRKTDNQETSRWRHIRSKLCDQYHSQANLLTCVFYLSKFHQRDKIQLDAVCHEFRIYPKKCTNAK